MKIPFSIFNNGPKNCKHPPLNKPSQTSKSKTENLHHKLPSFHSDIPIICQPQETINFFSPKSNNRCSLRESNLDVPITTTPFPSPTPQTWVFNLAERELSNTSSRIQLTSIESLLINTMTNSPERISSKIELITGINKDPQNYSGLEMSLSRLQNKFRRAYNERLFRSVRNRGYCLVQDIRVAN